jgi:hypothetical protein
MNIKFFKKENSFKKKNFKLNAGLYWKIFISGTFVIILFIFYFGYNLFTQINQEPAVSVLPGTSQIQIVDTNRIQKVLNIFSAREKVSEQIINTPSLVVDPSL